MVVMLMVMFVSELHAIRQKNVVLERDFIKAQKVIIVSTLWFYILSSFCLLLTPICFILSPGSE